MAETRLVVGFWRDPTTGHGVFEFSEVDGTAYPGALEVGRTTTERLLAALADCDWVDLRELAAPPGRSPWPSR